MSVNATEHHSIKKSCRIIWNEYDEYSYYPCTARDDSERGKFNFQCEKKMLSSFMCWTNKTLYVYGLVVEEYGLWMDGVKSDDYCCELHIMWDWIFN